MRRILTSSALVLALGFLAGCGGGSPLAGSVGGGQTFTLTVLKGQYAFALAGFDSSGKSMSMAGSFTADGAGHITAGEVNVNDNGTFASSTAPLTGTYAFDQGGANSLGTITLTNTVGAAAPQALKFGFALQDSAALTAGGSATGTFGDIMDLSANNFLAAGTMQQQSSSAFLFSALAGDYAVTITGRNGTSPTSVLGRFTVGATGVTSNVVFDRSIAGVGTAGPTVGTDALLTLSPTAPDANGRGTLTVAIDDALGNTSQTFAYYAITTNRFVAIENDANGTMSMDASRQTTPFTTSTVNTPISGAGAVFTMAGIDTAIPQEISAAGQVQITTQTSATLLWDSNDNGAIVSEPTLGPETVTFDSTVNIGRGTITVANGVTNGLANTLVFYLTSPGNGFILDGTSGVANRAMAGTLTAQTGTSFSTATDLPGLAIVRSRASSVNDAFSFTGLFGASSALPPYLLYFDNRFPATSNNVTTISTQVDQTAGSISVLSLSPTNGRGTISLPGSPSSTEAFYAIAPNQFVFVDISPAGSGANGASSVFFANPQ